MKVTNTLGLIFSGTIGKRLTICSRNGTQYVRRYFKPRNPSSPAQVEHRRFFSRAVEAWRHLDDCQEGFYDRIAVGMSGFNLFVSRFVKALKNGENPELPLIVQWRTKNRRPVEGGRLIVSRNGKLLFIEKLEAAKGKIALTPSDVPYTFVLKKEFQKETALEVRKLDWAEGPMRIESESLGIRLVACLPPSPKRSAAEGGTSRSEGHPASHPHSPAPSKARRSGTRRRAGKRRNRR